LVGPADQLRLSVFDIDGHCAPVAFPGAVVPDAPLLGGAQLTSYMFNSWRMGLPS
jgi:hypothetical protein